MVLVERPPELPPRPADLEARSARLHEVVLFSIAALALLLWIVAELVVTGASPTEARLAFAAVLASALGSGVLQHRRAREARRAGVLERRELEVVLGELAGRDVDPAALDRARVLVELVQGQLRPTRALRALQQAREEDEG